MVPQYTIQEGTEMTEEALDVGLESQIPEGLWKRIKPLLPPLIWEKKPTHHRVDDR